MKSKLYIYMLCCLGLVSCNDYLDKQPGGNEVEPFFV